MSGALPRPYQLPRRRHFIIDVPDLGDFLRGHQTNIWAENKKDAIMIFNATARIRDGYIQVENVQEGKPFV